jgi:hypothetical protein
MTADWPRKMLPRGAVCAVVMPALRAASISLPPGRMMSEASISGWRPGSCVELGETADGALWPKRRAASPPPPPAAPGVGLGRGMASEVLASMRPG